MNCLLHPDIIRTRVPGTRGPEVRRPPPAVVDVEQNFDSQVSDLTGPSDVFASERGVFDPIEERQRFLDLNSTRSEREVIAQGPSAVDSFNFEGDITKKVFQNCIKREERLKKQDEELRARRLENRERGMCILKIVGRITSGKMYGAGIVTMNNAGFIVELSTRQKIIERKDFKKECKHYISEKKKFDEGLHVSDMMERDCVVQRHHTNATLQSFIKWKWMV